MPKYLSATFTCALPVLGLALGLSLPGRAAAPPLAPVPPEAFFISQYTHPRWHPEPKPLENADCGPTAFAMVLKAFGKVPDGPTPELVRDIRIAMTGWDDSQSWTYPAQFPRAAAQYGLESQIVRGGAEAVLAAIAVPGRLAIVNVNPTPAYADRLAHPVDGGHYAVVTHAEGGRVALNDPLADGPLTISREQLELALNTPLGSGIAPYNGGVVLWAGR